MAKKEKAKELVQEEEAAIISVSEEVDNTPVEEQPEEEPKDEKPRQTFSQGVRRIFVFLLRLVIVLAILVGVGAAAYFGLPILYEQYVRPVEQNTSQLSDLKFRQDQSDIQIADLQTRLATLEAAQTPQNNSLTNLDARVQTLEGADVQRSESLIELTYQSDLLRAMELLSRARTFLYQSNFGLARLDVQAARNVLAEMQLIAAESKQKDLTEAIFRLDLVLKNLPDFPVAASDDLDIAWQVLLDGYPVPSTQTPTPVATLSPEGTATPFAESTATPTAIP